MVRPTHPAWPLLAVALLFGLAACGGDGGTKPRTPDEPPSDGGSPPADPGPGGGAPAEPGTGTDPPPADPPGTGTDPPPADPGSGGGGAAPVGPGEPAGSPSPGATVFARMLGGAGHEVAVGPLAFDADGGLVALSKFGLGDGAPNLLNFGIARFDAAGALRWSKSFATHGNELHSEAVAISPVGNVFVGFENDTPMDLGGGPLPYGHGVVVKLAPDGRFVWQRTFDSGGFSGLAVDGSGSVLVAVGQYVAKLRWDGEQLWRWFFPGDDFMARNPAKVAFDPAGHAIVAIGNDVFKLDAEGDEVWKVSFGTSNYVRVESLGTTAKGTVVAAGRFYGGFSYAGTTLEGETEYDSGAFVAVIEADGRSRWARSRGTYAGPLALDPAGRLAMLEGDPRFGGCDDVLAKWDLTGKELWRRKVATCDGSNPGAWARGVGVAPSGAIWVQGDAIQPFDVGTGTLVPRESDWFLMRVAP